MIVFAGLAILLAGFAAGFVIGTAYGVRAEDDRWTRRMDDMARRQRQGGRR